MEAIADFLLEPFRLSFMVRALLISVLIGVLCPIVGCYVITRGLAFLSDAIAHAVMPGMVLSLLLGLNPLLGTIPAGIAVAFLVGSVSRRTGVGEDTAIGLTYVGLFAAGVIMLKFAHGATPVNLEDLLIGQVLAVSADDVLATVAMTVVVLGVLYAFHKELVFTSFDPIGARVIGINVAAIDYLLLALIALVVIIALQAVGVVLVVAMIVAPAAAASQLTHKLTSMMAMAAAFGAATAVVGLYASYYLNLPSGPSVTLAAIGVFACASLARRWSPGLHRQVGKQQGA